MQRISSLNMFITPKAEKMSEFYGIANVEFEFPQLVRTVLFIHCGLIRASVRDRNLKDYYEVVGRLYESNVPQASDEKHIGKLYIYVHDYPIATRFETNCEIFEWHPDGSFDVVSSTGSRTRITSPDRS